MDEESCDGMLQVGVLFDASVIHTEKDHKPLLSLVQIFSVTWSRGQASIANCHRRDWVQLEVLSQYTGVGAIYN